jgi:adenylate cyclase
MIEDLHWLDAASGEFLEHMVDAQAGSRHLLLVNFRPEYRADWMQKSWYRQIPLAPLGVDGVAELLADLLGSDPSIATLAAPIHTRTGGNPFFTEEVAQSLIESGHLAGTRGAYRLVVPIERVAVPATVQAVLAARIDRLPEREKRLLQVAAVIGKDFPEPLLAAVAELSADELKAALAALRRTEFIHEQALYPVAEYAFKHPLTQEVALGSQLRERRRQVHAAVARAIEQQEAAHLDELAPLLAHHWEEAGDPLVAARWHQRAAEWVGSTNYGAASHHWGRLRALVRGLPGEREAATMGLAACTQILNMSWRVGAGLEEAPTILAEGQAFANALGDQRAHLILSLVYGRARCSAGDVAEHLDVARQNCDAARALDDPALQATAAFWHVDALCMAARFPAALAAIDAALTWIPRKSPPADWVSGLNPHTICLFWRGVARAWTGSVREGIEDLELVRHLGLEDGTPEVGAYANFWAAQVHYLAGEPDLGLRAARQLEDVCRTLGDPANLVACRHLAQGCADLAAGRVADAIGAARAALETFARVEKQFRRIAAALLAEALLLAGDYPATVEAAQEAIDLSARSLRAQYEARAHGVMARALLRRDGAAAGLPAAAALASAAALIESSGATTLVPLLCEWRAELASVLGDDVTRVELLQQAQRGYDEIGAPLQAARIARERDA